MTCKQTRAWLIETDGPERPPVEVRHHLRACPKCRRYRRRLASLHAEVRRAPVPVMGPETRVALLARLQQDPAGPTSREANPAAQSAPPAPAGSRRLAWILRAAAVLAIAAGCWWLLSVNRHPDESAPRVEGPTAEVDVLARLVEKHLQLAEGCAPAERLRILADMADDLRAESFRLALRVRRAGDQTLPVVAELYRQLIRDGVVARARRLPAAERREVLAPVLAGLRRAEEEARKVARGRPVEVAAPLQELASAARDARSQLAALLKGKAL